jgi:alkylresorcinol/alkylpyrone synthase
MANIISIGIAVPPFVATQSDAKDFATHLYGEAYKGNLDRLISIFENTLIRKRHFCVPVEWFSSSKSFEEKNNLYLENALRLSEQAIENCLQKAQVSISEIDYLLFVSTTGLSTPTIDARLIDRLPFRKTVRRLPLWGLGCAGGASSLSWAKTIAEADSSATILIVVTELCGLTFVRSDMSKAALISSALFADGSAAVLVQGSDAKLTRNETIPKLLSTQTSTMPNSLNVMGWRFNEHGFNVILSQNVPDIVESFLKEELLKFLKNNNLEIEHVRHFITHPGGAKVLEAYKFAFGLSDEHLRIAYQVLSEYGNMSAVTVLFILERFMENLKTTQANALGLLAALGPGFSAEMLLLEWEHK